MSRNYINLAIQQFYSFSRECKFNFISNGYEWSLTIIIIADATLLILTYGLKDKWVDLVSDPLNDLFSTTTTGDIGGSATIIKLVLRIKQGWQIRRIVNIISFEKPIHNSVTI